MIWPESSGSADLISRSSIVKQHRKCDELGANYSWWRPLSRHPKPFCWHALVDVQLTLYPFIKTHELGTCHLGLIYFMARNDYWVVPCDIIRKTIQDLNWTTWLSRIILSAAEIGICPPPPPHPNNNNNNNKQDLYYAGSIYLPRGRISTQQLENHTYILYTTRSHMLSQAEMLPTSTVKGSWK